MTDQSVAPLEFDPVLLPPAPGSLPIRFFFDVPSGAPAIFSTLAGERPFRTLQAPIPVHLIQAVGNGLEHIHKKAWAIMAEHPEISESVTTPPTTWKDMYNFFDAVDLWKEGPGFLFHVVGFIYTVNITRFNAIQSYALEWVSQNEERIVKIPATEDILCHLTTEEDLAFFDFDNLTKNETCTLRSALAWHRDELHRRQEYFVAQIDDAKMRVLADPSIISMERQRPYAGVPLNPNVHNPIDTHIRQLIELSPLNNAPAHSCSDSYYLNGDYTQPHENYMRNPAFGAIAGVEGIIPQFFGSQNDYNSGPPVGPYNPHGGAYGPHPSDQFGRLQIGFTGCNTSNAPIYVFNPQKPVGGYPRRDSAVGPQRQENMSYYGPEVPFMPARDQGLLTQASRVPIKYCGISNDARRHYSPELTELWESPPRKTESMASGRPIQPVHRAQWPRDNFAQACTVFVGGFYTDERNTDWIPQLLSQCGNVVKFKSLGGTKNSGFVTFDNVECVPRAIERFHGFKTWEDLYLTVAIPRTRSSNDSYPSSNSGDRSRATFRNGPQGSPSARSRDRQYSNPSSIGQTWSHSRNSSSHTTPPKYHSPVENRGKPGNARVNNSNAEIIMKQHSTWHADAALGPDEDCFHAQLDTVAKAAGCNANFHETTPRAGINKGEHSGRTGDRRRGSIKSRKSYSNKSELSTSYPRQTPPKKGPEPSKFGSGRNGGPEKNGYVESTPSRSKRTSRLNSQNKPGAGLVNGFSQSPDSSISAAVQHVPSSSLLSKNLEVKQVIEKLNNAVSYQPLQNEECAGHSTSSTTSPQSDEATSSGQIGSTGNPVKLKCSNEAPGDNMSTPKRKKKNSKRFSKGSKGSIEADSLPATIVRIPTEQSVGEKSDASFSHTSEDGSVAISHLRSDSNATTISALSREGLPAKAESVNKGAVKGKSAKTENSLTASRPPSTQIAKVDRANQPTASDDVFGDDKRPTAGPMYKPRGRRHTKTNSGSSSGSSTRKHDVEALNAEGSSPITPGKKVKPASQKRESAKKAVESHRKENEKKTCSASLMLSDPFLWPKLGENQPAELKPASRQRMQSPIRPLGEPAPPQALLERDSTSMAPETPQNGRGQTLVASLRGGR